MLDLFRDDLRSAFLTKSSTLENSKTPINIILSPEYYWVKKVDLPFSSIYRAKKYAPSIFEDNLPLNEEYDYMVKRAKDEKSYIFLAYNKDKILDSLKKQVTDIKMIKAIYWTQFELSSIKNIIKVDECNSLINVDEVILFLPRSCEEEGENISTLVQNLTLSNNYTRFFSLSDEKFDSKIAFKIFGVLLFLIGVFLMDYGIYKYKIMKLERERILLQEDYNLPATLIQRRSIYSSLYKKYTKQRNIRDFIDILQDVPLSSRSFLKSVLLKSQSLELEFFISSVHELKNLKNFLKRRGHIVKSSFKNGTYWVIVTHD